MGCECEGIQGLHLIGAENRLDLLVIPVTWMLQTYTATRRRSVKKLNIISVLLSINRSHVGGQGVLEGRRLTDAPSQAVERAMSKCVRARALELATSLACWLRMQGSLEKVLQRMA